MWWRHFYRLMEKPPEGGGDPGGGGEDPPKDPPGGGDPPKDPPKTVSLDVLPEELRNRPEAEQKFLLEAMVTSLGTRNTEVSTLREEIAELRGGIEANKAPPEPDPHEGKTLSELMLEDSEAAMDRYMEQKGYVKAFSDLSGRVGNAEFEMVASKIDDFAEYEEDVKTLLKEGNLAATAENVRGAYTMAVGSRILADKAAKSRAGGGSIPPSSPPPDLKEEGEKPALSSLETEIAAAHHMTPEEWVKARDEPMELKLPTG